MILDDLDRRLLERIQSDFPLAPEPFRLLAEQLGTSADDVLQRVRRLQESGTIRQIGPIYDLKRLGFTSTLCAARVAPDCVEKAAEFINGFQEVTHNYLREHAFNVWFTLIVPTEDQIEVLLDCIRRVEGVEEAVSLPAERMFKIKVHFATAEDA